MGGAMILRQPNYALIRGDCVSVMGELQAASCDAVICDLPYGTTRATWDAVIPFESMWAHYRRVCRGPVVLFAQAPFDKALAASNLDEFSHELIWRKNMATGHLNAKRAPLKSHETIMVFNIGSGVYFDPQKSAPTGELRLRDKGRNASTTSKLYGTQSESLYADDGSRYPQSVIEFPVDRPREYKGHPTQKPLDLLRYIIRSYTRPGAIILANTMGSGTTGAAAILEGRQFIGIERDPDYFDLAMMRLAMAERGEPI